jgi:hypothetical protein
VTQTVTPSLQSYEVPFSTYFWYSCAGGKFGDICRGLFCRKVAYIRYDVPWWMDVTKSTVRFLYEPGNVTVSAGNLTEKKILRKHV